MKQNTAPILLVEDNISDAKLTTLALKGANISNQVVHAQGGQEALDYIFCQGEFASRKIEDKPCLILLDLKMPKVNGIEVLQKIKADDRTKNIPVVVFSSSPENADLKECYRLGVNSYIVKPMEYEEFQSVVKNTGLYWIFINQLPQ